MSISVKTRFFDPASDTSRNLRPVQVTDLRDLVFSRVHQFQREANYMGCTDLDRPTASLLTALQIFPLTMFPVSYRNMNDAKSGKVIWISQQRSSSIASLFEAGTRRALLDFSRPPKLDWKDSSSIVSHTEFDYFGSRLTLVGPLLTRRYFDLQVSYQGLDQITIDNPAGIYFNTATREFVMRKADLSGTEDERTAVSHLAHAVGDVYALGNLNAVIETGIFNWLFSGLFSEQSLALSFVREYLAFPKQK